MAQTEFDVLRLENQLCFPLYACAREVVRAYKPLLDEIGLTYTQYITMMLLWEKRETTSKYIGARLHLDSGTLTPVLKSLEAKGFVCRYRSTEDERVLIVEITEAGRQLRDRALNVPAQLGACVQLEPGEAQALHGLLYKLLGALE